MDQTYTTKKFLGLDEDLYKQITHLARREKKTVGTVMNEAMALRIAGVQGDTPIAIPHPPAASQPSEPLVRPKLLVRSRLLWVYMIRNGMGTQAFANELGISKDALSRLMRHRAEASKDLATRMSQATGYTFDDLFPGVIPEPPVE